MSSSTLKELVITGALWAGFETWATQILSFSIYALLARLVGPTSFGLIALAGVYLAFIEIFAQQGFGTALIQRKDLQDAHLDSAFWLNLLVAASLTLVTMFAAGQLALLFGEPRLTEVLRWLSGALILKGLSAIPQAVLERGMAFRALAIRSLLATLTGGVVGLGMAWGGLGVWSLVGQQLSSAIIGTAVLWWATSWRPSFHISRSHIRDLYGFSIKNLGNELLWFGTQRVDQALIGFALGASALGPYTLASRVINISRDFVRAPLETVALPAFSKIQDERERLRNAFYKLTEVVGAVTIPTFFGLAALAPSFVPVIFGAQWSSSIPLIQILSLYGLATVPLSFGHPLMIAVGRPGACLMLYVFETCLTIGFCLLAIRWGPVAVACAVSLAMVVYSFVFLAACRKFVGISIRVLMSLLWAPTLVAIVMFVAVLVFQASASVRFGAPMTMIAGSFLGAGIYCAGMVILRPELLRQLKNDFLSRVTRIAA